MGKLRVSIRLWSILQIIPAVCLFVNYYITVNVTDDFYLTIRLIAIVVICVPMFLIKCRQDIMDESAKMVLSRANICYKGFFLYAGGVVLGASMVVDSAKVIGYLIAAGFAAAVIARAVMINILDRMGMME